MRVTAQAKEETRQRIIEAARRRFARDGFTAVTTRDLATEAGVAAGTLFNYFPSKEALAMSMLLAAQQRAIAEYEKRCHQSPAEAGAPGLIEDLFAFIATMLRALKPHRTYLAEAIESALSPFAAAGRCPEADAFRAEHLERVADLLRRHAVAHGAGSGPAAPASSDAVRMHLYWTIYLGILSFWSRDRSARQEQTLAMLDQSVRMFASFIQPAPSWSANRDAPAADEQESHRGES